MAIESKLNLLVVLSNLTSFLFGYRTDLLYLTNDSPPQIKVALANKLDNSAFTFVDFNTFLITPEENPLCSMPSKEDLISWPHSNSFLDLDGDCIPDIFMQKVKKVTKDGKTLF